MRKIYLLLLILFISNNVTAQKKAIEERCPKLYKQNFTEIVSEKYKTIVNNDTITLNEVRFECVFSAFYTHKVMYDKFGKWNKMVYPNNSNSPILSWENIDLFSNGKKYNIFTNGHEKRGEIYASIMIFDERENDLLSENSLEKDSLINFFSNLLKNNKDSRKSFYEVFGEERRATKFKK
ncbi:hypothetical protein [Flavobacterium sp.]|uniref:hypothetical protein n=1 Tax=Flavobacterium sp. TaxID=239 RepID=UPI003265BF9E